MIVQTVSELPDLSEFKVLVFDIEGSGLSVHHGDRACGFVIGTVDGDGYYVPIRHSPSSLAMDANPADVGLEDDVLVQRVGSYVNLPLKEVMDWLQNLANDPDRTWVMHNAKFDMGFMRADGVEFYGKIFDTMVMAHNCHGSLFSYSMEACTRYFLEKHDHPYSKAVKAYLRRFQPANKTSEGNASVNYSCIPINLLAPYGLEDFESTKKLAHTLNGFSKKRRIMNQGNGAWDQKDMMINDMRLVKVLWNMEWRGIKLNRKRCIELRDKTENEVSHYKQIMYDIVGYAFNIGSWKQMMDAFEKAGGRVLYWMKPEFKDRKKYPHLEKNEFRKKQKLEAFTTDKSRSTGRPCWNSMAILNYLKMFKELGNMQPYNFALCYREVDTRQRQLSMYIKNYLKMADFEDRIHCTFNQHGTLTGRLSAEHPNLQNVSTTDGTGDQRAFEEFLEVKDELAVNRQIRGLFIASPGHVLVSIDYKQIEYRMAVYLTGDDELKAVYQNNPDLDFHTYMAQTIGIPRKLVKNVNFGMLYGMGANGLASHLTGIGKPTNKLEAQALLNKVFTAQPAIKRLIDTVPEIARRQGYVQNLYGRVAQVDPDRLYAALNYLDQGTCGDLMRDALVRVDMLIRKKRWPVRMLLTVHDEIDFEMPIECLEEIAPELTKEMCRVPYIDIPILCDIEVGFDWGNMVSLDKWLDKKPEKLLAKKLATV